VNDKVAPAQIAAIGKWGVQRAGSYDYLRNIAQPTLVVNGDNDVIVYTINSYILQQNLPNAQLILYRTPTTVAVPVPGALSSANVSMFLTE